MSGITLGGCFDIGSGGEQIAHGTLTFVMKGYERYEGYALFCCAGAGAA